jgi:hypothetical protein
VNLPPGTVLLDENFGVPVLNATDVPTASVYDAMPSDDRALIATMEHWIDNTKPRGLHAEAAAGAYGSHAARQGGIFMRDRYITPQKPYDQMRLAYDAANTDDIVAGVCETTESLAFSGMDFFALEQDEQDVYNQIAAKIDLDSRMREIWRDLFIVSQAYIAIWWERQTFKVRGKTLGGNRRRRDFSVMAPSELTLLDPLKIVPVGSTLFGRERLAYIATADESLEFDAIVGDNAPRNDEIVKRLVTGRYEPSRLEVREFETLGVPNARNLWLLNPENVFRHTLTRPAYERLAPVRMKSVFELLDMKAQLRQMERAYLLGNTNFIVVITKGTDTLPAKPEEVANLQTVVRSLARVPVLVGDHRLNVEIVTPKLDNTLKAERWNTIDSRISGRLLQIMVLGNYCMSADTEVLTGDGWKTHDQLKAGDDVLTLDTLNQTSMWQPCTAVNRFEHDGPMFEMTGRSHSSLSTANHRWWVAEEYGAPPRRWWPKWVTSEELNQRHVIPTAVPHTDYPSEAKYSDAFVELVAWWWTEGWIMPRIIVAGGRSNRLECSALSQSHAVNSDKVDLIRAACVTAFGHPRRSHWRENRYEDTGQTTFMFCHELHQQFVAAAPDKVPSPTFLRSLTRAQLGLFIDTSIAADGHAEVGGKTMFAQKDQRRVDAFVMACSIHGLATSSNVDRLGLTRITIQKMKTTNPIRAAYYNKRKPKVGWVHYKGIVWCPTTPNETWLARRNGSVFWTGNSAGAAGDDSIKLVKVMARGMESRRHMIRRSLEKHVFKPLLERNEELTSPPKLEFHPRSIALDFDAAYASFLFDLRQANDLSRETTLNQFDLDQSLEAELKKREKVEYDHIFQTQVPYSTPNPANAPVPPGEEQPPPGTAPSPPNPRDNGGGRRNGGGAAPGTGQGKPIQRRPGRTDRAAASEEQSPATPIPQEGEDDPGEDDASFDDPA